MSLTKKSVLALSMMILAPAQQIHALNAPSNLKDVAKLGAFLCVCPTLGYYFFHYPVDRRSEATIENILSGRWDNVIGDIFNWDNMTHFNDIIPGQRWKVFPYTISPKEADEKDIKFPITNKSDIKGFGLYHFCEKNMKKIIKYFAATGTLYGLLYGDLKSTGNTLIRVVFDAQKVLTEKK